MIPLPLTELQKITNGKLHNNINKLHITQISTNSKNTKKCLFLALKGEKFDGHDFISQAIKNGAQAICSSQKITNLSIPNLIVTDTLKSYQDIAHHQLSLFPNKVIGITGSSGKTSIRSILEQYLEKNYSKEEILTTLENTNNHIGVPANILRLNKKHKISILEMGTNHYGEIKSLVDIANLDIAILTNIGHSHIGNFRNRTELVDEKLSIFSGLKPNGIAILPYKIYQENQHNQHLQNKTILTFGEEEQASLTYSYLKSTLKQSNGIIDNHSFTSSLTGKHQFYNLAIIYLTIQQIQNIDIETFQQIALTLSLPGMRIRIIEKEGKKWINDAYNANPESMLATIKWFQEISATQANFYLILGDMLELGLESKKHHQKIIAYLDKNNLLKRTILIGKEMETEKSLKNFANVEDAYSYCQQLPSQSLILLKASRGIKLETIIP